MRIYLIYHVAGKLRAFSVGVDPVRAARGRAYKRGNEVYGEKAGGGRRKPLKFESGARANGILCLALRIYKCIRGNGRDSPPLARKVKVLRARERA